MDEYISEVKLDFIDANNVKSTVAICIGKPTLMKGAWECKVLFGEKRIKPYKICGEDSMQAMCLALKFIKSLLLQAEKKNVDIFFHDSSEKFPISAYF